jgi:hypothetical protein
MSSILKVDEIQNTDGKTGLVITPDGSIDGIKFPEQLNPSGRTITSTTMSSYEEGTWVPTGNGVNFDNKSGAYVKVGNLVYITTYFNIESNTDTRACELLGLPFKSKAGLSLWQALGMGYNNGLTTPHFWIIPNNTTRIELRTSIAGSSVPNKDVSGLSMMIAGTYYIEE